MPKAKNYQQKIKRFVAQQRRRTRSALHPARTVIRGSFTNNILAYYITRRKILCKREGMSGERSFEAGVEKQVAEAKKLLSGSFKSIAPGVIEKLEHEIRDAFARAAASSDHKEEPDRLTPRLPPELTPEQVASLWLREKWRKRDNRFENPPAFIKRVYSDLIGEGLIQADFRRKHPKTEELVDIDLYRALQNWLPNNPMPDDIDLPSKKEFAARTAKAIRLGATPTRPEMKARLEVAQARRIARAAGLKGH